MAQPAEGLIGSAFDALPEAYAVVDRDGRILRANGAFEALLSAGPGMLAGRRLEEFYADRLDLHLAPWREAAPDSRAQPVRLIAPGRPPFEAQMRAAPVGESRLHVAILLRTDHRSGSRLPRPIDCEGAYTLDFETGTGEVSGALAGFLGVVGSAGQIDIADWLGAVDGADRDRALEAFRAGPDDPHHLHRFSCRMRGADGRWTAVCHQARVLRRGRRGQPLKLSGVTHAAAPASQDGIPADDPRVRLALDVSGLCAWDYDFHDDAGEASGPLHAGPGRESFCFQDWRSRLHPDDVSRVTAAFLGLQFGGQMDETYRVGDGQGGWLAHHCSGRKAGPGRAFGYTRLIGVSESLRAVPLDDVEAVNWQAAESVRSAALTTWTRDLETGAMTVCGPMVERLGLGGGTLKLSLRDWVERIHPEDRERIDLDSLAHVGAAEGGEVEYRILDLENRYVRLRVRGGVSAQSADGRPLALSGVVIEVDESDALRRRLAETETRLKEAVEAARLTQWSFAFDTGQFVMSGPLLGLLDLPCEASSGEVGLSLADWLDRIHSDDLDRFQEVVADAVNRHGIVEIEYRMRAQAGGHRWLSVRGAVTERSAAGDPLRASGFLTDLTERRKLEEDLAHRERQLADAVEAGLVGVWSTDHVTGERFARGEVLRWFGKRPDETEIASEDWYSILHPESVEAARDLRERLADGEMVGATDLRLRSPDGWRWVRTEGRPVAFDAAGRSLRSAGVMIDVTAERAYAAALAHEKERIDTIYRRSPALMHTIDPQGRTLMVNDHWSALMGYAPEEVLGQPGSMVIHADDRERVETELIPRAFAVGELRRQPVRLVTKSGEVLETRLSAFVEHDPDGRPVAAHGVFEDVTDINRARRDLEAYAEELERTNRELNRFATVASHDLQEPLRKIAAFSSLLRRRYAGQLDSDADHSLDFLVDAAGRMRTLIDDLLAYSRASSRPLVREPVDLESLVRDILGRLEMSIEESGARVSHDALPVIDGDPVLLTQLFQNLISNAIKYRGSAPPEIRISAEADGEFWKLVVADNGIGIEPKFYDKIFAPFQRLHGREEYEGTGIGLAVCQQAVERHGGEIWIDSTPGEGSRFSFTLPAGRRQEAVA